jgi:lauroyl/myristoyl acyltransferase
MGFQLTVVAQDFKNAALTDIFTKARSASGHTLIPQQSAMLRLTKILMRKGHAAFLSDLSMRPSKAAGLIECFGFKTCVPLLHVLLAQRSGLAVLPAVTIPKEDGRFAVKLYTCLWPTKNDAPADIAQQCWDVFEKEIRAQPELWLWMYKHWRYLPGDSTDARYPDYANASKPFAKLVKTQP